MHIFNEEFPVQNLLLRKIIVGIFPLHQFRTKMSIMSSFKLGKESMLLDPFNGKITKEKLRHYNSIAFYFGCDLALYFSFLI